MFIQTNVKEQRFAGKHKASVQSACMLVFTACLLILVSGCATVDATVDKVKTSVTEKFNRGGDDKSDEGSLQSVEQLAESEGKKEKPLLVEVQEKLTTLGYDPGTTDGKLNARTEAAIQDFQLDHDMRINGRPSKALLQAIDKALGFI